MNPTEKTAVGSTARALVPLFRLYPWSVAALIAFGLLASLAEGIGIGLFIPLLQSLDPTGSAETGNRFVDLLSGLFSSVSEERRLMFISACILGSIALKALLTYSHGASFHNLDARISHRLRSNIFTQLMTVSYRFLERTASGKVLNTLSNETWRTSEALSELVNLITATCTVSVYAVLLLLISWKLTIIVALAMLGISAVVWLITRYIKELSKEGNQANAVLTERMLEGCGGVSVIRAYGREDYEQRRFDQASQRVSRIFKKMAFLGIAVNPVYEVLAAVLLVSILLVMLRNPANLPSLLVFIFVLYRLQPRVQALDNARVKLGSFAAPVQEVLTLLDTADKPYTISGTVPFDGLREGLTFRNVGFGYNDEEPSALEDLSLQIPAGQTTALVGPSGAGKSTLVKLILRLYDATEGVIQVDGRPLPELDLASWRSRSAWVSQDIYLFNASVRDNIAYGRLDATDEEIAAAARLADADAFIRTLPQGYDTLVGDRGVRLSGGQRQRITLARAILRDPDVLILDEATNALDSLSEDLIQEALARLAPGRTVVVVAHRLATIRQADHVVVLENGRIRAQGSFQHLLEHDDLFARLYHLQHRDALV